MTAVVVVGVATFLHSPDTPSILAAQAAAFGLGVAALGVWAMYDFNRPPMAGHGQGAPAALALIAAASGPCVTRNGAGLIAFGLIAALAGGESSLVAGWVITGIGVLAIPPPTPAGPAGELPAGLTRREAEILTMIADSMTNAEIAQTLVLSNHTIKTHINRSFAKTGSANRTEAARFARAHGLT